MSYSECAERQKASAGPETNPGEDDPVGRFGDLQV